MTPSQTLALASVLGGSGMLLLDVGVNSLTMWLTLATFLGYALIYTVVIEPLTAQNIVIGGACGAMPLLLGWTAVTGDDSADAQLLFCLFAALLVDHYCRV